MDDLTAIPLGLLQPHPLNSNRMPAALFGKLVAHLRDADRYPPVIVRRLGDAYQILDGHHRVRALRQLQRTHARCLVWDVGDADALLLLATLNRLQGHDDPRKRAALVDALAAARPLPELAARLPERAGDVEKLLALHREPPPPLPPVPVEAMPVSVHFFLPPDAKRRLDARLRALGGKREDALMRLVDTPPAPGLAGDAQRPVPAS